MNQQNKIIIAIILAGLIILISIFLLFNLILTGKTIEPDNSFTGNKFVTKVIDGDTVIIEGASVRLLGIDSDERGYPCYKKAKQRIEELILNKDVTLETDGKDKDQYERYLRYIFLNEKNINLQLVEEGLAIARLYPQNKKYRTEILNAEKQARENKIGCKWEDKEEEEEIIKPIPQEQKTENSEYDCSSNIYNCGDFSTHAQAQLAFEACGGINNDIHKLDIDADGDACETLT